MSVEGEMKILGGELKGRRIGMPRGLTIRPTADKVREALFNILKDSIRGASVLDLFAGSGSLGLEALSRGASKAVFIDIDRRSIDCIKRNIEGLSIAPLRARCYKNDALKAIKKLSDSNIRFDMIFIDPPYYGGWIKKSLIILNRYVILNNLNLIICEHFKKDPVPENIGRFKISRQALYGDTILTFYR